MPLKGGLEVDKGRVKGTDEPREFLKPFVTLFGQPARDKTVTRRNNPDSPITSSPLCCYREEISKSG